MTVITLPVADALPKPVRWERPPTVDTLRSPIPQGLLRFEGTAAVALKIAGNQTCIDLTMTMPTGFAYLMRNLQVLFTSDDLTNQYDNNGLGLYTGINFLTNLPHWNLTTPGEFINFACTRAARLWQPAPLTPKLLLVSGGTVIVRVNDMHADESPAGDFTYYAEFYIFDVDQIDKWEVNTPIPVISHTSF